MSNGILLFSDETLNIPWKYNNTLLYFHEYSESETSRSTPSSPRSVITRAKKQMHSIVYEDIDEDLIKKAAIKTKGGCGPSGLDADNWRRILVSNQFGSSP